MNYRVVLGAVVLAVIITLLTNWVMNQTNEGFAMDPASKFRALLNYIEFENENGKTLLRTKVPLVVENKVRIDNGGNVGGIQLQPKNTNAYSRMLFNDKGEIGVVRHSSDTGASTDMPVFGVDEYKGSRLVDVATWARGARARASGIWRNEFHYNRIFDSDMNRFFHSGRERNPWLEVKLNKAYPIEKIWLHNRINCCRDRLKKPRFDFYLDGRKVHTMYQDVNGALRYEFNVNKIMADTVRITNENRLGNSYLQIAGIKIFTKE
jgi:hypothetical protein